MVAPVPDLEVTTMAIVRWEPARELSSLQSEMNRLFTTFFDSPTRGGGLVGPRRWIPAMDLVEHEDDYVLRADLPGLSADDVSIELADGVLTVSGERRSEETERKAGYVRIERASGSFRRSVTLPDGTDPEAVEATFEDGVLEVRIPKPEERKPHRVPIALGGAQDAIESGDAA
jgi:HSP20 family protein